MFTIIIIAAPADLPVQTTILTIADIHDYGTTAASSASSVTAAARHTVFVRASITPSIPELNLERSISLRLQEATVSVPCAICTRH